MGQRWIAARRRKRQAWKGRADHRRSTMLAEICAWKISSIDPLDLVAVASAKNPAAKTLLSDGSCSSLFLGRPYSSHSPAQLSAVKRLSE